MQEVCSSPCCGIPCCGSTEQLISLTCGHSFCVFCLAAQKKNRLRKPASMYALCLPYACSDSSSSASSFGEPLTPFNRADAYRSRKLSCKSCVSLRCALCRRRFLLWPSMLRPNQSVTGTLQLPRDSDGSSGCSDSSSSAAVRCRVHASNASAAALDSISWKQWDLCWAKIGDWPYW